MIIAMFKIVQLEEISQVTGDVIARKNAGSSKEKEQYLRKKS